MTRALRVPDWPVPAGVRTLLTLRGQGPADGASRGAYGYFNLGGHVGDAEAAVASNRHQLQRALGARPVFMQQVHGPSVVVLRQDTPDGVVADAAVTRARGLACTVMVADCLPVLLAAADGSVVAAAHAGWRGLAAGVLERAVAHMRQPQAAGTGDCANVPILAWLGPCIGPAAFEVGAEVRAAFVSARADDGSCFVPHGAGKYRADLPALARAHLVALGIDSVHGNDGTSSWCTVQQDGAFYSHRRDQKLRGATGRMAACIWRT